MKTIKANKIAALTTAGAIAFANLGVTVPTFAAMEGATNLTLKVKAVEPSYELMFPSDTTVSEAGFSTLASDLGVKIIRGVDKINFVRVNAESNWKFTDGTGTNEIGYKLKKQASDTEATTIYDFKDQSKMSTDTGETIRLGIDVDANDYDRSPDGDYESSIQWTTTVDRKVSEVKIKDHTTTEIIEVASGGSLELEAEVSPAGLSVVYDWETYQDAQKQQFGKIILDEVAGEPNKIKITGVDSGDTTIKVTAGGVGRDYTVRVTG